MFGEITGNLLVIKILIVSVVELNLRLNNGIEKTFRKVLFRRY